MSFSFLQNPSSGAQQASSAHNFNYALNSQNYGLDKGPVIVVIGVGGAGCNAVNNMIRKGLTGVRFCVANTDNQSLHISLCENRIQLGSTLTNGLGAGSSPEIGEKAAIESTNEIEEAIKDANMVFITAGMGGGTGTGAAPIIADIARKKGILTIGVVTKPFEFERDKRMKIAESGIERMHKTTDTLIVISNQNVFRIASEQTTLTNAFGNVDDVLFSGIRCITDLVTKAGIVNLDFADVASVMNHGGRSVMGEGEAEGEDRAIKAAERAITNPILEYSSVKGAKGMLINITGGDDMTLFEVNDAIDRITKEIDPNATMKFGSTIMPELNGIIRVSVVATGVEGGPEITRRDTPRFGDSGMFSSIVLQQKASNNKPNISHFTDSLDSGDVPIKSHVNTNYTSSNQQTSANGLGGGIMSGIGGLTSSYQSNTLGQQGVMQNFTSGKSADINLQHNSQQGFNAGNTPQGNDLDQDEPQFNEEDDLAFKGLAGIKKIERQNPIGSQEQPRLQPTANISRKIVMDDDKDIDKTDVASNGVDKVTSFFGKILKPKK